MIREFLGRVFNWIFGSKASVEEIQSFELDLLPERVLFVCSGNTCRSPMAEEAMKAVLREDPELAKYFVCIGSGGLHRDSFSAADNARDVVKVDGGSLENHRARKVTAEILFEADIVLCATSEHVRILLEAYPEMRGRVRTVTTEAGMGGGISDPFGSNIFRYYDTYYFLKSVIKRGLRRRLRIKRTGLDSVRNRGQGYPLVSERKGSSATL